MNASFARDLSNNKLKKGRWSWISNCSEAFHTDSWLAEANPGHSDRDAILQALLPGPRYGSTLGPGKARMSDPFPIKSGVKRGCVIARSFFGISLSLLLACTFNQFEDGAYFHTRIGGGLFNLAWLQAKTKVQKVLIIGTCYVQTTLP